MSINPKTDIADKLAEITSLQQKSFLNRFNGSQTQRGNHGAARQVSHNRNVSATRPKIHNYVNDGDVTNMKSQIPLSRKNEDVIRKIAEK